MFTDRWKRSETADARSHAASAIETSAHRNSDNSASPTKRRSSGLEQFFTHIRGEENLDLLDFSGASQANIEFITSMGHRLYSEDLIATLDFAFGGPDNYGKQLDPVHQQAFLAQNLNFKTRQFDGALLWDALEFLAPPLLPPMVDRLRDIMKPGAYMLALFHTEERCEAVPTWHYRIANGNTLLLAPRGSRRPAQHFSNRAVEKLFQDFDNVKFFLTRDSLREVIVKR
ncbi:MAG TPA: class I SAM-dependent methyltransferase [Bryobacteraceae bacterium]|nr:class I SAM-dependent methyltransferase [Bryobacteraceae bacterium]